jgi:hypothetical protein
MFKIIDNFFPAKVADKIEQLIRVDKIIKFDDLPVNVSYYNNINTNLYQYTKSYSKTIITKNILEYTPAVDIMNMIITQISTVIKTRFNISSARINYMNQSCGAPTLKYDVPHVDIKNITDKICTRLYTLIYYVNHSHGDTILYKETSRGTDYDYEYPASPTCLERIATKKNRLLLFDTNHLHNGPSYCAEDRYVINLNITTEFPLNYDKI